MSRSKLILVTAAAMLALPIFGATEARAGGFGGNGAYCHWYQIFSPIAVEDMEPAATAFGVNTGAVRDQLEVLRSRAAAMRAARNTESLLLSRT